MRLRTKILLFTGRILRPIRLLAGATERLGRGERGGQVAVRSGDEIGDLARSFNRMSEDLARTTVSVERVRIEIEDNGPGLPDEILGQVFDPFFTTKDPERGTGLGLAISRTIVEEFGGEIRIRTAPGQGATMTILLPCESSPTCP